MGSVSVGPDGSGGPHAFVADVEHPMLEAHDEAHLRKSLRMRDGDSFTVADGRGRWRPMQLGPTPEPTGDAEFVVQPAPLLVVAFALTKGSKPEFVVQKLTELGIDTIVPFVAERSIPRWDHDREAKNLVRMRRVALEAAMQSRQVWLPEVTAVTTFAEVVQLPGAVRADMGGEALGDQTTVLIGPEGGWSNTERSVLGSISLGRHVLRAETAAVAAGALMGYHRVPGP
jgi:16S rRNA (uracil1498-N3)-methyltransferase